jgi:hypothetical protein
LNEQLDGELRQALAVLAMGHDTDKKSVTLNFLGLASGRSASATSNRRPSGRPATGSCSRTRSRHCCRAGRLSKTRPSTIGRTCG